MKTLLFVLLFFTTITFAQEEDSLNFYPFHVGDIWQYIYVPENYFRQIEVLSVDTLYADSSVEITTLSGINWEIKYKIFFNDIHTIYWNIDTGWSVAYKFDVPVNSNWLSYPSFPLWTVYKGEFWDNYYLFEDSVLVREYVNTYDTNSTLYTGSQRLAKNIGFYYAEGEFSYTYLTGCIVNGKQYGTIVDIDEKNQAVVAEKIEIRSYPNPFNTQTNIAYTVPYESRVTLKIYNTLGEEVETLYEGEKSFGNYLQVWNAHNRPSGIYYAVLQVNNRIKTTKLIYLK